MGGLCCTRRHSRPPSGNDYDEVAMSVWALLEKDKVMSPGDIAVYKKCYHSLVHWRWACLFPGVFCTVWVVARPEMLIHKLGNEHIADLGIVVLVILLSWSILLRVIGMFIVNGKTFCNAIEDFKLKSQKENPTSHLLFGYIDFESLLWLLMGLVLPGTEPGYFSNVTTMSSFFLLVFSPPQFKARFIGNQYAKEFIESLRVRIQNANPLDANVFAEVLKEVRVLRKTLDMLYSSVLVYTAAEIFPSAVVTIVLAVLSVACAQSKAGLMYVFTAASVSMFYGYNSINLLLDLAKITDACVSPDAGLLGDVLEHGERVGEMSERAILQFQALKDDFRFNRFGAKVGIVIEQSVIFTALASSAAGLFSFVSKLWHVLHE